MRKKTYKQVEKIYDLEFYRKFNLIIHWDYPTFVENRKVRDLILRSSMEENSD